MIPQAFEYVRPSSVDNAIEALREKPGAKLLAGGHSLLPLLKLRLASVPALVDIAHLAELRGVWQDSEALVIGALTTHADIAASELVRGAWPVLARAAERIGDVQVRNRGTIGGNLAHADPASDLPGVMLALDATLGVAGPDGAHEVSAAAFWTGPFSTVLGDADVLTAVRLPAPPARTGSAYRKLPHPASGYAVVAVSAVVTLDPGGGVARAALALGGVAAVPFRARAAEAELTGRPMDDERLRAAAERLLEGQEPMADLYASADYRGHMARPYAHDALREAGRRAAQAM